MKVITVIIAVALSLSAFTAHAGRDGAQLMLQDQLNKRAAAERQSKQPTPDEIRACQASSRRVCPNPSDR